MANITVIVEGDSGLLFFKDISDAQTYIEYQDVEDGVYREAYDDMGNRLVITSRNKLVFIDMDNDRIRDQERLKNMLVEFVKNRGLNVTDRQNIDELLALCEPYISA